MRRTRLVVSGLALLAASATAGEAARAQSFGFSFGGPGVGGTLLLTFGAATDAKYPSAFEVTGISGTFTDTNNGLSIVNAPIGALVAVNHATPEPTNLLAPHDFSRFAVGTGLPPENNGFLTYDNLYWPGGSPPTASDYPPHGGFLDIYGLMFDIGGGRVVDVWSNGVMGPGPADYGVGVATANTALDYVGGGVSLNVTTPEPGSLWLVGAGGVVLLGLVRSPSRRRRTGRAA